LGERGGGWARSVVGQFTGEEAELVSTPKKVLEETVYCFALYYQGGVYDSMRNFGNMEKICNFFRTRVQTKKIKGKGKEKSKGCKNGDTKRVLPL